MNVLVDTDVVIDYINGNRGVARYFSSAQLVLYCSSVTMAEACASRSLSVAQKQAIRATLRRVLRVVSHRDPAITRVYDDLRSRNVLHGLRRADALIAATAISKRMVLWTGNRRHFEVIEGLKLFEPSAMSE